MEASSYLLVCLLGRSEALPLSVNGGESEKGWVSTPNVRGTLNILISSLTTMSLCAWTAYHPNVRPNKSELQQIQRRLFWILVAILVPEVLMYCAMEQWWTARRLQKEVNSHLGAGRPETIGPDKEKSRESSWSLEHAFYATCGGIAVDSSSFWHQPTLTFTPAGIAELAANGLLPSLPQRMIKDKSKANTFAKLLVCVQGVWFFVQSIARLSEDLPLPLLELCTLVHVACVLVMYLFWVHKPYNVEYPTYISIPEAVELAALLAVDDEGAGRTRQFGHELDPITMADMQRVHRRSAKASSFYTRCSDWIHARQYTVEAVVSPEVMKHHHQLATKALDRQRKSDKQLSHGTSTRRFGTKYLIPIRSDFMTDEGNFSMARLTTFIMISGAVSSAHLGAWDYHFATTLEKWLWRASALLMVATVVAFIVSYGLSSLLEATTHRMESNEQKTCKGRVGAAKRLLIRSLRSVVQVSWFVAGMLAIVSVPGRLFTVGEVFASMRAPPLGTYETVGWTDAIPHIG